MKKILLLMAIIILFLASNVQAEAAKLEIVNAKAGYSTKIVNGIKYYGPIEYFYFDGRIAYCLEPTISVKDHNYTRQTVTNQYSPSVINAIELIAYYGYEYDGHQSVQYYMATQQLIWEALGFNNTIWSTEILGGGYVYDLSDEINKINNLIREHNNLPDISHSNTVKVNSPLTLTYGSSINLNEFIFKAKLGTVQLINNSVIFKSSIVGEEVISVSRKNYKSNPSYIYTSTNSQTLATFGLTKNAENNFSYQILPLRTKKLKVNIYDTNNNHINDPSLKFKIRNAETDKYLVSNNQDTFLLDENGYLKNLNISEGTWYIQNINVPNKYVHDIQQKGFTVIDNDDLLEVNFYFSPVLATLDLHTYAEKLQSDLTYDYIEVYDHELLLIAETSIYDYSGNLLYQSGQEIMDLFSRTYLYDYFYPGNYCLVTKNPNYQDSKQCFSLVTDINNVELFLKRENNAVIINVSKEIWMNDDIRDSYNYINIYSAESKYIDDIFINENALLARLRLDKNGRVQSNMLPIKFYIIPDISSNYQEPVKTIYNQERDINIHLLLRKYSLSINNVDEEGNILGNSNFIIYNDQEEYHLNSANNQIILPINNYNIKIIKTADGFYPLEHEIKMYINNDCAAIFVNKKIEMPNTTTAEDDSLSLIAILLVSGYAIFKVYHNH